MYETDRTKLNKTTATKQQQTTTTTATTTKQQRQQQQFYYFLFFSIPVTTLTTLPPDRRQDLCFKQILRGTCFEPILDNVTRAECCCSNIAGAGWSSACQRCPLQSSGENEQLLKQSQKCANCNLLTLCNNLWPATAC